MDSGDARETLVSKNADMYFSAKSGSFMALMVNSLGAEITGDYYLFCQLFICIFYNEHVLLG